MPRQQGSRARSDRAVLSCTECRRRKQKCNRGQPCSNCFRRFPPPICEYIVESGPSRTRPSDSTESSTEVSNLLEQGPYSHIAPFPGIGETVSRLENVRDLINNNNSGSTPGARWVFLSQAMARGSYSRGRLDAHSSRSLSWDQFEMAVKDYDERFPADPTFEPILSLLNSRSSTARTLAYEDLAEPVRRSHWLAAPRTGVQASASFETHEHAYQHLPMKPTKLNKELIRTYLQVLSRFKVSLDGCPNSDDPFMRVYIPPAVQNPVLLQVNLYTTSAFFAETKKIPNEISLLHKGAAIEMLNHALRSPDTQLSDVTILAVSTMVLYSWYWAEKTDILAHITGLRRMIQLRRGFDHLGMHGYLAKSILLQDVVMSLAHEVEPYIYGKPEFSFHEPSMVPFRIVMNTPLLSGWPPFSGCIASLELPPNTALILDDMRVLLHLVLSTPLHPTETELQQVTSLAAMLLQKLEELPDSITPGSPSDQLHSPPQSPGSSPEDVKPSKEALDAEATASSSSSSPQQQLQRPWPVRDTRDWMYRCIRMTAKVYCKAVITRSPTSTVCDDLGFLTIWETFWKTGLPVWASALGVFAWVMVAIMPSCHNARQARFIKTLMVSGFLSMGIENWHYTLAVIEAGLQFQRWVSCDQRPQADDPEKGLSGSKHIIDKYGFPIKEHLPRINIKEDEHDDEE